MNGPVCLLNAEFFGQGSDGGQKVDIAIQFAPLFGKWLDANNVSGIQENQGIAERMRSIMGCIAWDLLEKPHNPDVQSAVTAYKRLVGLVA